MQWVNDPKASIPTLEKDINKFTLAIPHKIPEEIDPTTLSPQDELMRWHYLLNHLPLNDLLRWLREAYCPRK